MVGARVVRVEQAQDILMGVLAGHSGCYLDSVTSLTSRVNQSGFGGRALEGMTHSGPDRSIRRRGFRQAAGRQSQPPAGSQSRDPEGRALTGEINTVSRYPLSALR